MEAWIILIVLIVIYIYKRRQSRFKTQTTKKSNAGYIVTAFTSASTREGDKATDNWKEKLIPVNATLHLNYQNSEGEITERTVDVQKFGYYNDFAYLTGFCRLRQDPRTFRIDRILQCVDMETGEIIENIYTFLQDKQNEGTNHFMT